jgi:hypothetical protein
MRENERAGTSVPDMEVIYEYNSFDSACFDFLLGQGNCFRVLAM